MFNNNNFLKQQAITQIIEPTKLFKSIYNDAYLQNDGRFLPSNLRKMSVHNSDLPDTTVARKYLVISSLNVA